MKISHEPDGYDCPFCRMQRGEFDERNLAADVVAVTDLACTGTSIRQHNEPAGNQDVWHLHVHVFPRHEGDGLYLRDRESRWVGPEERAPYAARLREAMGVPFALS